MTADEALRRAQQEARRIRAEREAARKRALANARKVSRGCPDDPARKGD